MHEKEVVYVPEMIFGMLLTSSNYNDLEKEVTGGRNGYGAKLANIFSTEFTVETQSAKSGKAYKQVQNYAYIYAHALRSHFSFDLAHEILSVLTELPE